MPIIAERTKEAIWIIIDRTGASASIIAAIISGTYSIKPTTIKRPMKKPMLLFVVSHPNCTASLMTNFFGIFPSPFLHDVTALVQSGRIRA